MDFKLSYLRRTAWLYATALLMSFMLGGVSFAAMPPAGYVIGNQAAAEYQIDGQTFKVTSNLVETIIAKKAALTLTSDNNINAVVNSVVYFPHQIVNTGNSIDSYNVTSAIVSGGLTNVAIYADANGDGSPDNTVPITVTPQLAQNEVYNIVVSAMAPSSATSGSLTVTATSVLDSSVTTTNTDSMTIVDTALVTSTKSFSVLTAKPGETVTVSLHYSNDGSKTSGQFKLEDTLPTGLTYVAGSAKWTGAPGSALTDATGTGDPTGIDYSYDSTNKVVTAIFDPLSVSGQGILTFNVTVNTGFAPGAIHNQALVYCDCNNAGSIPTTSTAKSNNATLTILSVPGVLATDDGSTTDFDNILNDTVTRGTGSDVIYSGSAVLFDNVIKNTGNGVDSFNIIIDTGSGNNSYPAGTSFTIVKSDGVTPLTDSNNDGVVDTGPLNAGASYHIFVRAQLPPNVGSVTGPFTIGVQAVSITASTASSTVTNKISEVTPAAVDLTNDAAATQGGGPGPESSPVTTKSINPGSTATFDLYINHTASIAASYDLGFSDTSNFTTTNVLPAGWQLMFVDAVTKSPITSATLNASTGGSPSQYHYQAVITAPASAVAGAQPFYFRVKSNALGIQDVKYDQVTVNTIHDVALSPSNIGQVYPGGSFIYSHQLQNLGNVTESSGALTVVNNLSSAGWVSTLYLDVNNNGDFDPGTDTVISDISQITGGIAPQTTVTLFVKVQAPAGALSGDNSVSTLTVNVSGDSVSTNNSVTDQATVISGYVTLKKEQSADSNCSAAVSSATYQSGVLTNVKPGECVIYRVTAVNNGTDPVSSLLISDQTPLYTSLHSAATTGGTASSATLAQPSVGSVGQISATWPTVNPGQTAILFYRVQLDQ